MPSEDSKRRKTRKSLRSAYVEYCRSGTRLSRLFQSQVKRGPIVDIGENGVQFRSTEALDVGEVLYVTLRFQNVHEPVKLKAEVRWSREDKNVGMEHYTHVIGVQILEYAAHGWDLITEVLKE